MGIDGGNIQLIETVPTRIRPTVLALLPLLEKINIAHCELMISHSHQYHNLLVKSVQGLPMGLAEEISQGR